MSETLSADLRNLAKDRDWFGYLTLENAEAVGERIRALLDGKRYTFVACNQMGDYQPEVRAGQWMRELRTSVKDDFGHVSVSDTYGVWGISTAQADQRAARQCENRKRLTYLHIKHDRVEIEHYAISGNHLHWAAVVESPPESPPEIQYDAYRLAQELSNALTGHGSTEVDRDLADAGPQLTALLERARDVLEAISRG